MGNQQLRIRKGNYMNLLEKRIKAQFPKEKIKVLSYTKMTEAATVMCLVCGREYAMSEAQYFLRKDKTCICRDCFSPENQKLKYQEKIN